jgi:ribosomal protein S18 acetylase RimI-like enzyme
MNACIVEARKEDLPEILSLQKQAFREAVERYKDPNLPPLRQSLPEIEREFSRGRFLVALVDGKIVGSVRANEQDGTCYVGKLVVDPNFQNQGIGTRLMEAIEASFPQTPRIKIFTGFRDEKNLYLYKKLGYCVVGEGKSDTLNLVYMKKNR